MVSLLQEAKINPELWDKIKELAKKQRELASSSEIQVMLEPEREIIKIKLDLKTLENDKLRLEKAGKNIEDAKNILIAELKKDLEKINILLE
jgi:hypothetical protein